MKWLGIGGGAREREAGSRGRRGWVVEMWSGGKLGGRWRKSKRILRMQIKEGATEKRGLWRKAKVRTVAGLGGWGGRSQALDKLLVDLFFRSDANPKALLTYDSDGNFGENGLSL